MSELPSSGSERDSLENVAARFHKRTQFAAAVVAGIGLLTGIGFAIVVFDSADLDVRGWIVRLSMPLGAAGLFAAATYAASVFFAPAGYFETQFGAQLLTILQTRSIGFARVIAVVLMALCLAMFFVTISYAAAWSGLVRVR